MASCQQSPLDSRGIVPQIRHSSQHLEIIKKPDKIKASRYGTSDKTMTEV